MIALWQYGMKKEYENSSGLSSGHLSWPKISQKLVLQMLFYDNTHFSKSFLASERPDRGEARLGS